MISSCLTLIKNSIKSTNINKVFEYDLTSSLLDIASSKLSFILFNLYIDLTSSGFGPKGL